MGKLPQQLQSFGNHEGPTARVSLLGGVFDLFDKKMHRRCNRLVYGHRSPVLEGVFELPLQPTLSE
jgi:hypothetical protein